MVTIMMMMMMTMMDAVHELQCQQSRYRWSELDFSSCHLSSVTEPKLAVNEALVYWSTLSSVQYYVYSVIQQKSVIQ